MNILKGAFHYMKKAFEPIFSVVSGKKQDVSILESTMYVRTNRKKSTDVSIFEQTMYKRNNFKKEDTTNEDISKFRKKEQE